jgi:hypothetical protein
MHLFERLPLYYVLNKINDIIMQWHVSAKFEFP